MAIKRRGTTLGATEVLDRVLDKGIVIDADVRVAVADLDLATINAVVRIASLETRDRYVAARERCEARRPARSDFPADPTATHRVRLRCEDGCTFERRASALVIRDGRLGRQRCAAKLRRECRVILVSPAV
jgi:gas vesicle structural protein